MNSTLFHVWATDFLRINSFAKLTRLPGARVRPSPIPAETTERSEGSLDAGEHRGPLDGRWVTIHPQILPKTPKNQQT
jgi:hypothetical protein